MIPARTIQEFVDDPIGRFREGASYVVWCHSRTLCGSIHWGRATEADARELSRLFDLSRHPEMAASFDVILDASATEGVDWAAFVVMSEYVANRLDEWSRRIRRQAVLIPPGPPGAAVAGMVPLLGGMTYPMRYFETMNEATHWLDRSDARPVLDEMAARIADIRGVAPVVRALREHLDSSLEKPSIMRAASALGVSPRSLQRELLRAGSGFSAELLRARVRAAGRMLERTNDKIEAIARRVGCSSSSQLSTMFRRVLGETPLAYRARSRAS